ncbi:helix-turn-helix domain-containing protein [Streptomyces sp. NPDC092046]|uniref:nSTAND1 domain-containing NTPase n=1 Tax=Streptomyces sp. NPDC092046 TaxID=3366009 RepID=UPI003825DA38
MGRRERPLDPTAGATARFAHALRKLRQEAGGLTYRAMAARAHYSTATLAQAAAGERLPSLSVVRAYVVACGGDPEEWERRWHEALRGTQEEARADEEDAEPPYLGLARFGTGHEERFFGRDPLVARLVELVRERRLVVLTGPSGSGKSSLLRAGLIPRLRRHPGGAAGTTGGPGRTASVRILTPGAHPADAHGHIGDAGPGTVVVVDQFEEVFTLCADQAARDRFIDVLLDAAEPDRGVRVVLAVRADFHAHLARHRRLSEAAREATLLLSPMDESELREAVVRPAALDGLVVERTLTARIVREVAEEPGGLPLMSHALLETWRRRRGRVLTEAAYDAAGGIHGAVAHTAEEVFARFTPGQAATARRILLRLVSPGEGTPDTRRPTTRAEIAASADADTEPDGSGTGTGTSAPSDAGTAFVLERLARARLITLDGDTVDLAHEAVLAAWPRLRGWLDEDRERLRTLRRLTEAADAWEALGRDPGALYRGVRLADAEQQVGGGVGLTPSERAFLTTSAAARRREHRGRRARAGVGSVLLVLSLVASLVAWQQNRAAERRHVEAEARRVAGVSYSLQASDPQQAMRLGLAAWRVADLPETRAALSSAMAQREQDVFTDPDGDDGTMRRLSGDGRTLISVGADQVTWWDVAGRRRTGTAPGLGKAAGDVAFPQAGARWLPEFGPAGRVSVRDLDGGGLLSMPVVARAGVEMGAGGRSLLAYDTTRDGFRVQLWDLGVRRPLLEWTVGAGRSRTPHSGDTTSGGLRWEHLTALRNQQKRDRREPSLSAGTALADATVSPDDRYVALCVPGERLQLWDVARRRRVSAPRLPEVTHRQCLQERVAFSADGRYLGLIGDTGYRAWDVASGRELPQVEHPGLETVELAADGAFLGASDGKELLVWRVGAPLPVFRHRLVGEVVKDLRIDPRAGVVRYLGGPEGSWGPTVHTLSLDRSMEGRWDAVPAVAAAFGPGGGVLATARGERDRVRFRLFDPRTGKPLAEPGSAACRLPAEWPLAEDCGVALAFDAAGRRLAYGAGAAQSPRVSLYDVRGRRALSELGVRELGPEPWSYVAFGGGAESLVVSGPPGPGAVPARVRDLRRGWTTTTLTGGFGRTALHPDGSLLVTARGQAYRMPGGALLPNTRSPGKATALAFSSDGALLAVGDASGRVALWDGRLGRRLGVLPGEESHAYQFVSALAFSPDGRTLAVAGDEGTLQLWDTASHQRIGGPLSTPGDRILALAFDADGTVLRAAGDRTPPQSYPLAPDRTAAVVCRRVGGAGLSRAEWRALLPDVPYADSCPGDPGARGQGAGRGHASQVTGRLFTP